MTNSQPKDLIDEDSEEDQEEIVDLTSGQKQWVLSEIARLEAQPHSGIKNLLILTAFKYLEKENFQLPRRVQRSILDDSSHT